MTYEKDEKGVKKGREETDQIEQGESRRRFIKKAGTAGLAVPVITTLAGKELLTRSAHAETPGDDGEENGGSSY